MFRKKRIKLGKIKKILGNSFQRDILVLVLISVLMGSLLAGSVSMTANAYFSKTVASLVGDYGQQDIVIQVREEMREDSAAHIQKILDEVYPGAVMKEGSTITGKTTFFITLPDQYKTQKNYEELSKVFGSIPGGAGVGVITEPRLTIRGVPEGAKNTLMDRIMKIEGVRFVFRDGASIGVILDSVNVMTGVSSQINSMLKEYQVIEISFPVGSEPANPVRLGDDVADALQSELKLDYAKNVSTDGKNDDMTYMVSTMSELKRFLQAYASQVTITPAAGTKLEKGDSVVLQGHATAAPVSGNAPVQGNVVAEVAEVRSDGSADGSISQGDASWLESSPAGVQGYKLEKGLVGSQSISVSYRNPRQELGGALTDTGKLVAQIPGFAQDAKNISNTAFDALDNYGSSIQGMQQTLSSLQSAGSAIQAATGGLANLDTTGLQNQLDNSSRSLGGMVNTLQVLKLMNADVSSTIDSLNSTQRNLNNVRSSLSALDNIAANGRKAKTTIDNVVANGQTTINTLKAFNVEGARAGLTDANTRLAVLGQVNVPVISAQIQYLANAVPNLKDEEISHSVKLLDKFIAGQVIPGARIQILTTSKVSVDAVTPIVQKQVGHNNISLYSSDLGVIEPNTRAELQQMLGEIKSILAGMTAIIATVLFLGLDHTAIMTVIRRKRLSKKNPVTGWRKVNERLTIGFTAAERRYGMAVGAVMLTSMFLLTGGGMPYLPWIGVPVLGALLGLIVAAYAEKISPIAAEEVMAGEALGMSFDEIMREIVIPSGRPGLMHKLNNRKVKFK
ncbi:MAG TPA: hypothetical protein PKA28_13740 [Methylomusa anaerophila]|uniref:Uncharacterized protein n=1 Tax=Methylomusa anaerophila TaxID=1930071 RepID=A0A348AKG5_9FIRM|nr:hypothetical protein [Methylomusa anaerophila]BBB91563.1 hypothetical protein MAMMFC1_02247 [Methylomusa anaerophila]HML89499.1 hypothetical protein [Methylomusa anaerophila]